MEESPAAMIDILRRARFRRRSTALLLAFAGFVAPRLAAADPPLTVARIMARDWIGTAPEGAYWSDDGRAVYWRKRRAGEERTDLYRLELARGAAAVVEDRDLGRADAPDGVESRDRRHKVWQSDGDLFVKDLARGGVRQLTRTSESESDPLWLADGERVAFRRGDAFYAVDLAGGGLAELADLRLAKDPEAAPKTGFLVEEQRRLLEAVRRRHDLDEARRARERELDKVDPSRPPRPWFLGADQQILAAALSPSARWIFVALGPASPDEGKEESMPVWMTESGYVEPRRVRTKVGTGKPETPKLALLDLETHERIDLDPAALPGITDDPLAALRAAAKPAAPAPPADASAAAKPAAPAADAPPAPRTLTIDRPVWNEAGDRLALELFSTDNKDRWIAVVDPAAKKLQAIHRLSDPAWVNYQFNDFGWTRDGRGVWYLSEETGYSHLYLYDLASGHARALTQGPFEVDAPRPARDGKSFLVTANRERAAVQEVYRVRLDGSALERLTSFDAQANAVPSPDDKQLLVTVSTTTHPPELYVQAAKPGAAAKKLTASTTAEFDARAWVAPQIVAVPSRHGAADIWSRLYLPPDWRKGASYPAVLFVHGAGYLQDAHAGWSYYYRELMFHTLLAERGVVVLDMDYRGSAGYGRNWRTAIYRQMGWPELEDLRDGVAWLADEQGVDPRRVAVYGGSYGGFLTLMALFRDPDLFQAGAALRPVTDWAHYNHGYTANILNTPDLDPEAYRKSSPIEFAQGLAKPLLICHGMVDDNVTFSDSVRLAERLMELGKSDLFETAIYPAESHAFREPWSWTDEYTRILKLFERTLDLER